jgi:uncharacterized caspase-like protein/tetratricopeptide (TPR) repeat protein
MNMRVRNIVIVGFVAFCLPLVPLAAQSAKEAIQKGGQALAEKKYDEAIRWFQLGLSDSTRLGFVYFQLGVAHEFKQEHEKAAEYYRKAFDLGEKEAGKSYARIHVRSLQQRISQGDVVTYENELKKLIALVPNAPEPIVELARLYDRKGDYESSSALWKEAAALLPHDDGIRVRLEFSQASAAANRQAAVERVIAQAKYSTAAYIAALDIVSDLRLSGRTKDLEQVLAALIKARPKEARPLIELVSLLVETREYERIIVTIRGLPKLSEQDIFDLTSLCRRLIDQGQTVVAEAILLELREKEPDSFPISSQLLELYLASNDQTKGLKTVEVGPTRKRVNWVANSAAAEWALLAAQALMRWGEANRGKEFARAAVIIYGTLEERAARTADVYLRKGIAHLLLGELNDAVLEFQKYNYIEFPQGNAVAPKELKALLDRHIAEWDVNFVVSKYFPGTVTEESKAEGRPPRIEPPPRDTVAPTIRVLSPIAMRGMKQVEAKSYAIEVTGLAADNEGISLVYIGGTVAKLSQPSAADTSGIRAGWRAVKFEGEAMLAVGSNSVEIRAIDLSGNLTKETITVYRQPDEAPMKPERPVVAEARLPNIWGVVVGVSEYQNQQIKLRYAHKDAEAFYRFLISPFGGAVSADRIDLLTNRNATRAEVIRAINDKLRRAFEDDMVVVFIAAHGIPDEVSGELYFLGYDADLSNIAGTAISQIDIQKSISSARAKKIVFIADACHSGTLGLSPTLAKRADPAYYTNKLLKEIASARDGVAMLTASSASEYSQEGERWNGHGVFTYYLVEGLMNGKADFNADGVVTIREIYEYTYRKVAQDTEGKQHPDLQGKFDNNLPLSVTK